MQLLQDARANYLFPLLRYVFPVLEELQDPIAGRPKLGSPPKFEVRFKKDMNAMIVEAVPQGRFEQLLASVLMGEIRTVLGLGQVQDGERHGEETTTLDGQEPSSNSGKEDDRSPKGAAGDPYSQPGHRRSSGGSVPAVAMDDLRPARTKILGIFRALETVGLGGGRSQRVFATLMDHAMTTYVSETFAGKWRAPSTAILRIRDWVENHFARLIVEVLNCVGRTEVAEHALSRPLLDSRTDLVTFEEMERWRDMCIGRLGRLRIGQLFDIVVQWEMSKGAVQDLKAYTGAPPKRNHLIASLIKAISHRLLHPGASTIDILQVYISLIRVFAVLDAKGVLIDRVARPVRAYLRERDDTVKVIVSGLLADVKEGDEEDEQERDHGDVLVDLAAELYQASARAGQSDDDHDFDWDDMQWAPDPVDAGPEYKRSRSADVIGSVMSLFDSKDVLIKEFQHTIGERLLKNSADFEQEIRVLELLKVRFGEGSLQASEVMLRDVHESRILDRNIHEDQDVPEKEIAQSWPVGHLQPAQQRPTPHLHAKVLSRFFWPQLHEESFTLPAAIVELQKRFETGFENMKPERKLTWLNALGQVTVDLELADRNVTEEVTPWQASVIHAFHEPEAAPAPAAQQARTVAQLMTALQMQENLVRSALRFWVSKTVLHEVDKDSFAVLERLDQAGDVVKGAAQVNATNLDVSGDAQASEMQSFKSAEDVASSQLKVYWQFIVGMLTNGGPMPLSQIATMLKFAVAGRFPFGDGELREYLSTMVREGKLDLTGEKYKIRT